MKLNLSERYSIVRILPKEGNFATVKILDSLKNSLSPSEEEHKEFEIVLDGQLMKWNKKGTEGKEILIGEIATGIIKQSLTELEKTGKLPVDCLSIYEKFV